VIDPERLHVAREVYARGENVRALFRAEERSERNSEEAILVAYDLQRGSYRSSLADPEYRAAVERYARGMARELDALEFDSMLDAGTGEATTLMQTLAGLRRPPSRVVAFDSAWSRVAHARAHSRAFSTLAPTFFAGNLFEMPVAEGAFDLVFTSHALEPNSGRELEGLSSLARVARRWLVLFEPSYELGGEDTRRHMDAHGYVRGLCVAAEALGLKVVRHALLPETISPVNLTAVHVFEKPGPRSARADWLVCPRCRAGLREVKGHLFCAEEGLVFPVLDGIPCLEARNAVLASAFADVID
jgi:hypothetical protein